MMLFLHFLVALFGIIGLLTSLVLAVDVLHRAADRASGLRRARLRRAAQLVSGLVWTLVAATLLLAGLLLLALVVMVLGTSVE